MSGNNKKEFMIALQDRLLAGNPLSIIIREYRNNHFQQKSNHFLSRFDMSIASVEEFIAYK